MVYSLVYLSLLLLDINVGIEESFYDVIENEGRVEVCVVVEQAGCGSSDVFTVELNTRNDSAGMLKYSPCISY